MSNSNYTTMEDDLQTLQKLLNEINTIIQQDKIEKEESRKRGELFNVFEILGLQSSEVRLHSAFIAELLNPDGNHGLGDKFLKSFVEEIIVGYKPFDFDFASAQVFAEYVIGNISEDYQEGGRIDLLIQDKNKQTIIIENKIYAGDQTCQLLRYHNFAENNIRLTQDQYILLYLTLNGNEPSVKSIGSEQFQFFCISYRKRILNWLEKCIEISTRHPLIRETIQQYIVNIKNILSTMENSNNMEKYMELLISENNISATIDILKHSWDIECKIRSEFVQKIQKKCEEIGFHCEYDKGIVNCEYDKWIKIYDNKYKEIIFRVGAFKPTTSDGYRMDIIIPSNKIVKDDSCIDFWLDENKRTKENPLGWTYLWSKSGKQGSGKWWMWWGNWDTLCDMANGKMVSFIAKTLDDIKEKEIFKRISDILVDNK